MDIWDKLKNLTKHHEPHIRFDIISAFFKFYNYFQNLGDPALDVYESGILIAEWKIEDIGTVRVEFVDLNSCHVHVEDNEGHMHDIPNSDVMIAVRQLKVLGVYRW